MQNTPSTPAAAREAPHGAVTARASHARITHHVGDVVAPLGEQFPKGIVQSQEPGNHVVVLWPSGLWTKHHATELRRAA
jgi:hypothetical protein